MHKNVNCYLLSWRIALNQGLFFAKENVQMRGIMAFVASKVKDYCAKENEIEKNKNKYNSQKMT